MLEMLLSIHEDKKKVRNYFNLVGPHESPMVLINDVIQTQLSHYVVVSQGSIFRTY